MFVGMPTLPDNVTLEWIGRQLIELRDDVRVMDAILRRVEHSQEADREERRGLFDAIRHVRERVDKLES